MHEIKLKPRYYDFIKSGTKRIEIRLNDEKRKKIKVGDTIRFYKMPELKEYIDTKVIKLHKYNLQGLHFIISLLLFRKSNTIIM